MSEAFTAYFPNITNANGNNLGAILNQSKDEVLKIQRIGIAGNFVDTSGTHTTNLISIRRYTLAGLTGYTYVTPVSHDLANVVPDTTIISYGGTPTGTFEVLRNVIYSTDERVLADFEWGQWSLIVPWNIVWDAGYLDSTVQPLTLRAFEMVCVWHTNVASQESDLWIEFLRE